MPLVRTLDRATLVLTGEDRVRFLHGMVTNDIEKLQPGQGCHAAMLTTKGKMVADLVVYAAAESLTLELQRDLLDKVRQYLDKHIVMDDVELADGAQPIAGVYGDDAAAALAGALGLDAGALSSLANYAFVDAGQVRVARTPELGGAGFHVIGGAQIPGTPLGDEEWEARRIEAGTPLYGVDMGEDRLPIEAGVTDAVSFDKGCYLGQEVIARATNLGHINRKLVGLVVAGESAPARGAKLTAPTRPEAGVVTSSARARGRTIALAYVHRTLWDPGTKLALDDGREAVVTSLPFPAA